jgi:hypothetical protein
MKCKLCNREISDDMNYWGLAGYCSFRCYDYASILQIIQDGIENKGYLWRRIKTNPDEKIFLQEWQKENKLRPGIDFGYGLLQDLFMIENRDEIGLTNTIQHLYIEPRDRYIVATVIQWLGTNCGRAFLEKCIEKCGYEIIKKSDKS